MINKKTTQPVKVSDEFISAYTNFNVSSQEDQMRALTERELYLLLVLCLDHHSDEDPVCINNFKPFMKEVNDILIIQDDAESNCKIILDLIEETSDKYISTDSIVDMNGDKLKDPLSKSEVMDAKLGNVLGDSLLDPSKNK